MRAHAFLNLSNEYRLIHFLTLPICTPHSHGRVRRAIKKIPTKARNKIPYTSGGLPIVVTTQSEYRGEEVLEKVYVTYVPDGKFDVDSSCIVFVSG